MGNKSGGKNNDRTYARSAINYTRKQDIPRQDEKESRILKGEKNIEKLRREEI